jgi:hypothetical protein
MMGYSIAVFFTANIWICFGAAITLGIMSLVFIPAVVILSTAVWGGITLGFSGLPYIGVNLLVFKILAAIVLSIGGVLTQYSMNSNHAIPSKDISYGRHEKHEYY